MGLGTQGRAVEEARAAGSIWQGSVGPLPSPRSRQCHEIDPQPDGLARPGSQPGSPAVGPRLSVISATPAMPAPLVRTSVEQAGHLKILIATGAQARDPSRPLLGGRYGRTRTRGQ